MTKKITILYSGGLDSFLMYKFAKITEPHADINCLFFAHGQDAEETELKTLPDFVTVRKIDWLGKDIKPVAKKDDPYADAIYIPGRNLVFAALAASQELSNEVWMGTVWDEDNTKGTDKNEKFRNDTSNLLTYVLSPFIDGVVVKFPFVEKFMTKELAIKWALNNGVTSEEIVNSSVSCWHPKNNKACGECKQCTKRMLSFGLNGFEENYIVHPTKSKNQQGMMIKYLEDYLNPNIECNRDELNMVDMMVRYFPNTWSSELSPWEEQMKNLIDTILENKSK